METVRLDASQRGAYVEGQYTPLTATSECPLGNCTANGGA
jgi:hypothetical protein